MRPEQLKSLWTKIRTDKKSLLCLAAGTVGLLLLLFSAGGDGKTKTEKAPDWNSLSAEAEQTLEKRAERLLSTVAGVGSVRVAVTLKSLETRVYAVNRETGAEGRESEAYVILSEGNGQTGLSEKILLPEVRGVAVSCDGGGNPQVQREVCALLCAVFGVPANRVHVSPMKR